MKLKCTPEDFVVTEVTDREPSDGRYALYRLQKQSIGTLEALQILQRLWNLPPKNIAHGGLKDRHASTTQLITVRNGPRSGFQHALFTAEYLGQTAAALEAGDVVGNHFDIVIRSLSGDDVSRLQQRVVNVQKQGYPNYFDHQRFGSLGPSQEFVGAKWCLRDYERALWLALAEHNRHDNAAEREQKQILRDQWGRWSDCKQQLSRSHRRSVVTYLCDHPSNFRKAFALINVDLRGLYLSAFQSAVWNRMLAATLRECSFPTDTSSRNDTAENRVHISIGDSVLPFSRFPDLPSNLHLPLPSVRCKGLDDATRRLCDEALKPYHMTLSGMKVSFPRDRWFSRALRQCMIIPQDLTASTEDDDRYQGRRKLTLSFALPRGCYATMLIKSLTGQSEEIAEQDETGDGVSP